MAPTNFYRKCIFFYDNIVDRVVYISFIDVSVTIDHCIVVENRKCFATYLSADCKYPTSWQILRALFNTWLSVTF